MTSSTNTVPRIARCSQCGALVLSAWSDGAHIAADVATFPPEVAQLSYISGQTIYRIRSTRRPTLSLVANADEIIDHRVYVLAHACPEPSLPESA